MTFTELAKDIGQDKEVILKKLELVFGRRPNLEDEIIFDFPKRGIKKKEMVELGEELNVSNQDEHVRAMLAEEIQKLFEETEQSSEDGKKIDLIDLSRYSDDKLFKKIKPLADEQEELYEKYIEIRFQIVCLHWYAIWFILNKYNQNGWYEDEDEFEKIMSAFYATEHFNDRDEFNSRLNNFFKKHRRDEFAHICKYFEKIKTTDEMISIPDMKGLFRNNMEKLRERTIEYSKKTKKSQMPQKSSNIDDILFIERVTAKSLERLDGMICEINERKERATEIYEDYWDEQIPCDYEKTGKVLQLSKIDVDLIKTICTVIPDGKVMYKKLAEGRWEEIPLKHRKLLCKKINSLKKDEQARMRYIMVRKSETLGNLEFDELEGYRKYDTGGIKGILNMKTERIKDIILYPYYFKIIDTLANIFELWEIENLKKISEKKQIEYYRMLEKVREAVKKSK